MFKFLALFLFSSSIFAAAYEGDSGGIFALPVSGKYISNDYLLFEIDGKNYVIAGMPYVLEEKVIKINDKKIKVLPVNYGESRITIENDSLVNPSSSDQERAAKERKLLQSVLTKKSNFILSDIYITMGEGNLKEGWVVKAYFNPLVKCLWFGAFIMAIGGILSLLSKANRRYI